MADFFNQPTGLPADKVAIGYIITQWILDIKNAMKIVSKDPGEFVGLVNGLYQTVRQYSDEKFEKDIKDLHLGEGNPISINQAYQLYGALLELTQRSGFMPIKTYEGELVIDGDLEKKLDAVEEDD